MSVLQGSMVERNLFLTLGGLPALNVDPLNVVAKTRKTGQTAFATKVLDNTNWINLGGGFYILKFSPNETNTVGYFIYTLSGVDFDNFNYEEFTIEPVPEGLVVPPPDTCIITGYVKNITGKTPDLAKIMVRPVEFPAKYGQNIINADRITTVPDYSGQFQLELIRGAIVVIEIERAGIRHQITVPDTPAANLVDLLPAFAMDLL